MSSSCFRFSSHGPDSGGGAFDLWMTRTRPWAFRPYPRRIAYISDEDEFEPNRPSIRHRLYLPIFQLPYKMSGIDTRRFWCLLMNGPVGQRPFSAAVGVDGDVEELAREIQKEKHDLQCYDTSNIVLLKVRLPA